MKYIMLVVLMGCSAYAMESNYPDDCIIEMQKRRRPTSTEIVNKVTMIIEFLESAHNPLEDHDSLRWLLIKFLDRDSKIAEETVIPFLKEKLRDSDEKINMLMQQENRLELNKHLHRIITDSIEDAFKKKDASLAQAHQDNAANAKSACTKIILVAVGGAASTLAAFFGAYFGH